MSRKLALPLALIMIAGLVSLIALARASVSRANHTTPIITENLNAEFSAQPESSAPQSSTQGELRILDKEGQSPSACPLKHTAVKAEISGFLSRVTVTQEFHNPLREKIEAVYTFPLPQNAAIDELTMLVGDRSVRGKIKRREEARAVYEAARNAGHVASLLDQERPNIFTQSVVNIRPGEIVKVTISYVETLKYEDGTYQFSFPMVVGPRYIPGNATGKQAAPDSESRASDTDRVPDASRLTPPVAKPGTRAGHDISLEVALDAGVPLEEIKSTLHAIQIEKTGSSSAIIRLKNQTEIPNRDFILKYDVAGRQVTDALLTHKGAQGGFFTMILQPPDRVTADDVMPKELVFVLDTSGSMSGLPIEAAKKVMQMAIDNLYPQDTFNLITFSGDTHILFNEPVHATKENVRRAQAFLASRQGGGGTEMMKAIRAALDPSDQQDHIRIVCFMTDGYVGNDLEIISEVQKHPNARVFSFGIGNSVNRLLLDKMAEHGRGEVEYVPITRNSEEETAAANAAAKRFHERVRHPLLTDLEIEWNGLQVADVYPKRLPDLFSAKPVTLTGRFTKAGRGSLRLTGRMQGQNFVREIPVDFPEAQPQHDVLATLWARTRIDDLMAQDESGLQQGQARAEVTEAITQLGLEYRLMTQFTSFVAVEEMTITDGDVPRRIDVPVELPDGVSYEGVFGSDKKQGFSGGAKGLIGYASSSPVEARKVKRPDAARPVPAQSAQATGSGVGTGSGQGVGTGRGGNIGGGRMSASGGVAANAPQPSATPAPKEAGRQQVKPEADRDDKARSADELRRQQLQAKLHSSLAAVIERLKNKQSQPTAEEAKFVRGGKAELQIFLTDKSEAVIAQLKKLGLEIVLDPKASKTIIGRLPLEKLAALAELGVVRYIAPMTN